MAKKFPKILLLGKYGQLGRELSRTLLPVGELAVFDLPDIDFTKPMQLQAMITELKPQVIINAVAYTNVDLAETQQDLCRLINHESVAAIGAAAQAIHAGVIHVSTDYVFDGTASEEQRQQFSLPFLLWKVATSTIPRIPVAKPTMASPSP